MSEERSEEERENRLSSAYHRMLHEVTEDLEKLEDKTSKAITETLENARDRVQKASDLTREEAHEVMDYLRRDLQDLGAYLDSRSEDWRGWLRIDLGLIEASVLNALERIADRTRIEITELTARAQVMGEWHTGEITGPGELLCKKCGHALHMTKVARIPPCSNCHNTTFRRGPGGPEAAEA
ncbi:MULTISPECIES: zinc ribbon-containing protein [unclassified Thioalkalivibrio]|uniref:zinc ribbon-containing protein n=1 Tax=unclassified Thioalkalivibrio TaxID=2621013 RepID=UPI00036F2CDB|nr:MULTISPECIES: zinc ribbon-containing protein [unclassified Thioalkalivibrio]